MKMLFATAALAAALLSCGSTLAQVGAMGTPPLAATSPLAIGTSLPVALDRRSPGRDRAGSAGHQSGATWHHGHDGVLQPGRVDVANGHRPVRWWRHGRRVEQLCGSRWHDDGRRRSGQHGLVDAASVDVAGRARQHPAGLHRAGQPGSQPAAPCVDDIYFPHRSIDHSAAIDDGGFATDDGCSPVPGHWNIRRRRHNETVKAPVCNDERRSRLLTPFSCTSKVPNEPENHRPYGLAGGGAGGRWRPLRHAGACP